MGRGIEEAPSQVGSMTKIRKIAELAFHEGTSETEAVAAFLALRRLKGGLTGLKNVLSESTPEMVHVSVWTISGPDSFISKATYYGCTFAEQLDGKCHITRNKKGIFEKQKFTITLKYSKKYLSAPIEEQFEKILKL